MPTARPVATYQNVPQPEAGLRTSGSRFTPLVFLSGAARSAVCDLFDKGHKSDVKDSRKIGYSLT